MCKKSLLKHSDNEISRRQEVGRGLRLCVTQSGERVDNPAIVHEVNQLTVVVEARATKILSCELKKTFKKEIIESEAPLASRSARVKLIAISTKAYFTGKVIQTESGHITSFHQMLEVNIGFKNRRIVTWQRMTIRMILMRFARSTYHQAKERRKIDRIQPKGL